LSFPNIALSQNLSCESPRREFFEKLITDWEIGQSPERIKAKYSVEDDITLFGELRQITVKNAGKKYNVLYKQNIKYIVATYHIPCLQIPTPNRDNLGLRDTKIEETDSLTYVWNCGDISYSLKSISERAMGRLKELAQLNNLPFNPIFCIEQFGFLPSQADPPIDERSVVKDERSTQLKIARATPIQGAKSFYDAIAKEQFDVAWSSLTKKSQDKFISMVAKDEKMDPTKVRDLFEKNQMPIRLGFWRSFRYSSKIDTYTVNANYKVLREDGLEAEVEMVAGDMILISKVFFENGQWKLGYTETFLP